MSQPATSLVLTPSAIDTGGLTTLHGRLVNNQSDVYKLPADDEEVKRLNTQHEIFKLLRGKNYVGPVEETLSSHQLLKPAVIDLGCGSGAWGVDMAADFPHCNVLGVDLAPKTPLKPMSNYRFEVVDLNKGIPYPDVSFDLAHARLIDTGIKDYHALINEIGRILRPRGMVLLQEWDYQTYDADKHIISPRSDGERPQESWFVRWVDTVREAVMARGGDLKSVPLLEGWIESHGAFEEIGRCDMWLPLAPYFPGHDESERILNEVGKSFRLDVHKFIEGSRPTISANGFAPLQLQELVEGARADLDRAEHPMYLRVWCVWARTRKLVS